MNRRRKRVVEKSPDFATQESALPDQWILSIHVQKPEIHEQNVLAWPMPILKIGTGAARSVLDPHLVLIRPAFHAEETGAPVLTNHHNLLLHGALTPRQRVCVHGVQPRLPALFLRYASSVAHIARRRHATIGVHGVACCDAICGEILWYNARVKNQFF